jgi:tetratricopeptide (TPR) repeat protein
MNHFFLGESASALDYLEKAKRLDPSHFSHPQLTLAQLHAQQGRAPEAIKELEDFLRRHPDSPRVDQVQQSIENLRHR